MKLGASITARCRIGDRWTEVKGQEYRYRGPNFVNSVKYFWYTAKDSSDVKIYFQQKRCRIPTTYQKGFTYHHLS